MHWSMNWTGPNGSFALAYERSIGNNSLEGRLAQNEALVRQREISATDLERNIRIGIVQTLRSLEEAFNTRELLKVKVLEGAPEEARATGDAIAARLPNAHVAQTIGRTLVLYRRHPEKPEIRLPK